MKIAIDARFYGTENGGLGRYTVELINELQELDSQNSYYILLRNKYYKDLVLKENFHKVKAEARHYSVLEQLLIPYLLYKINPDLTHFLHFNAPLLYFKKYVITIHDLLMHKSVGINATTRSFFIFKLKRIIYPLVFSRSVSFAKKVIVPSNFVKEDVLQMYRVETSKISVIYEGVSPFPKSHEKVFEIPNKKYFLYAGNAYPHKNLPFLLEAFSKINRNIYLVLVIPRDIFRERLVREIERFGLSEKVILKYNVSNQELGYLYKNSCAFIYPSLSEGFGLQGLESMISETQLLASNIPVFHEIYKNHAIYFNPRDVSDLTKKILKVLNQNKLLRKSEIESSKIFASKYSWKEMGNKILGIYRQ